MQIAQDEDNENGEEEPNAHGFPFMRGSVIHGLNVDCTYSSRPDGWTAKSGAMDSQ